jgi:hypothetical protein
MKCIHPYPYPYLLQIMVTDMMKATSSGRAPDLGMDHRAIVWCHNFLLSMRTVIFTLVQTDRQHLSTTDRVDAVRESLSMDSNYDFLSSAGQLRITFRVRWMRKRDDSVQFDSTLCLEGIMTYLCAFAISYIYFRGYTALREQLSWSRLYYPMSSY